MKCYYNPQLGKKTVKMIGETSFKQCIVPLQELSFKGGWFGSFCSGAFKTELVVILTEEYQYHIFAAPSQTTVSSFGRGTESQFTTAVYNTSHVNKCKKRIFNYLVSFVQQLCFFKLRWGFVKCFPVSIILSNIDWNMIKIFILWATSVVLLLRSVYPVSSAIS